LINYWKRARNTFKEILVIMINCAKPFIGNGGVKELFKDTFTKTERLEVRLQNIEFNTISREDNEMLVGDFLNKK